MVLGSTDMLLLDIKWGSNLVTWAFGAKTVQSATLCPGVNLLHMHSMKAGTIVDHEILHYRDLCFVYIDSLILIMSY